MAMSQPPVQSKQLCSLVAERLCLMQEVAHYKAVHHLPLYVPEVEIKLLAEVASEANALGLGVIKAQATIALQMRFGALIQKQWCAKWQQTTLPLSAPKDLDKVLRPQLNRLTKDILLQMVKAKSELAAPLLVASLRTQCHSLFQVPFLSEQQKLALLQSLVDVRES